MKTYVKPELYFESFELSQHIAACDLKLKHDNIWNCCVQLHDNRDGFFGAFEENFENAFVGNSECKTNVSDFEIFCYTNGANSLPRLFQS